MIGVSGQLNMAILQMSAVTIPLVIVVTLVAGRFVQMVPDHLVRRSVFLVLDSCGYISDHWEFTVWFWLMGT